MFRALSFGGRRYARDYLYPCGPQRPRERIWKLPEPFAKLPIRRMNESKAQDLVAKAADKIFELGGRFILNSNIT